MSTHQQATDKVEELRAFYNHQCDRMLELIDKHKKSLETGLTSEAAKAERENLIEQLGDIEFSELTGDCQVAAILDPDDEAP